jgi:hypothetical protein
MILQAIWGYKIKRFQDPDLRSESDLDESHGFFGKFMLGFGYFTLVTGIFTMRRDPRNDIWEVFARVIAVLVFLAVLGFTFMERTKGRSSRYNSGEYLRTRKDYIFKRGNDFNYPKSIVQTKREQLIW